MNEPSLSIVQCKQCHGKNRVPVGIGSIRVTCGHCKAQWILSTSERQEAKPVSKKSKKKGLSAWMARKGAVGGTARWAGDHYLHLKTKDPKITVAEACVKMVNLRITVGVGYSKTKKEMLLEPVNKGIDSILELVRCVLDVEVGQDFDDIWWEEKPLYQDVIKEELRKKGVPESAI